MKTTSSYVTAALAAALLLLGGPGCDGSGQPPVSGLVVLDAHLDARRTEATSVALRAPVPAEPDDPRGFPALVAHARERLGVEPSHVTIRDLSLMLDDRDSTTSLRDVFGDDVEIRLQPAGSAESYLVAAVARDRIAAVGSTIVVNDATFDSDLLPDDARAAVLAGQFDVVVVGPAAARYQERRVPLQAYLMVVFRVGE